jgi:hypothetical protein
MYAAFVAFLGVAALMLAANEAFGRSAAAPRGEFISVHSSPHPSLTQSFGHHRRNNAGTLWPAAGGFFYGPSNGEPTADVTQPISGDLHYTYTYNVPWDWAHRYPPAVAPSERAYAPSCPAETVMVAGHDGKEQAVTIVRCY